MIRLPPRPRLFPYSPVFESRRVAALHGGLDGTPARAVPAPAARAGRAGAAQSRRPLGDEPRADGPDRARRRSEEHTSELQSRQYLVCRLLLEKKNNTQ